MVLTRSFSPRSAPDLNATLTGRPGRACLTTSSNVSGATLATIRATFLPWPYVRRIACRSTSATRHQNFGCAFEMVKNAGADASTRPDARPSRASPSPGRPRRSRPPPDGDSPTPAAVLGDVPRPSRAPRVASSPCQTSPPRRPPVERARVNPWRRPRSREGTVSSGSAGLSTGDGHVSGYTARVLRHNDQKLDRSARTHDRGALLERWLAQFWNEVRV